MQVTDITQINVILKMIRPKCESCTREMLPIGPDIYFCNYEKCKNHNIHMEITINLDFRSFNKTNKSHEDRDAILSKDKDKETQETKKVITGDFIGDANVINPRKQGKFKLGGKK